jgi:hypothetical protein
MMTCVSLQVFRTIVTIIRLAFKGQLTLEALKSPLRHSITDTPISRLVGNDSLHVSGSGRALLIKHSCRNNDTASMIVSRHRNNNLRKKSYNSCHSENTYQSHLTRDNHSNRLSPSPIPSSRKSPMSVTIHETLIKGSMTRKSCPNLPLMTTTSLTSSSRPSSKYVLKRSLTLHRRDTTSDYNRNINQSCTLSASSLLGIFDIKIVIESPKHHHAKDDTFV